MTELVIRGRISRWSQQGLPVLVILLTVLLAWYLGAWLLNAPGAIERVLPQDGAWRWQDLLMATMEMQRPVLPAPHQVWQDFWSALVDWPLDSPRNLLFHVAVTAESTLWGFVMGTLLGLVLSVCIVHSRTLDRALLPWIVASQTVPILAVAPIVIVALGSMGLTGVLPKAIIAAYLCFFPVAIGMVKGLTSPDVLQRELMRTWSASPAQTFWKLRLPASVPFLFASLKVAVSIGLVGAIVGELPTGAQAGLGARLLAGSYFGQTVQMWAALFAAAILAAVLVFAMGAVERIVLRIMGARPEGARR